MKHLFIYRTKIELKITIYFVLIFCNLPLAIKLYGTNLDSLSLLIEDTQNTDTTRLKAANELFWYWSRSDIDSAMNTANLELNLARKLKNKYWEAQALLNLSLTQRRKGQFKSATQSCEDALSIFRDLEDLKGEIAAYKALGISHSNLGNRTEALNYFLEALAIREKTGDSLGIADSYNQIGSLYGYQKDTANAYKYFSKSLQINIALKNLTGQASALNNLGALNITKGEYKIARQLLIESSEIWKKENNIIKICNNYNNIGATYEFAGEVEKSIPYYLETIKLAQASGYMTILATTFVRLGNAYLKTSQNDSSYLFCEKALAFALESNDPEWQKDAWMCLYKNFKNSGNIGEALIAFENYTSLKDSLINERRIKDLNTLELQYEFDKKELANALEYQRKILERDRIIYGSILVIVLIVFFAALIRFRQNQKIKDQKFLIQREQERQHQLEELDAMKSKFFANISHEFRTPLTLILGEAEQLKEKVFNRALLPKLQTIENNGHRLLNLVNQILDLARLEAGKLRVQRQQIDLIPYLKNLLFAFESLAEPHQQTLRFTSDVIEISSAIDPEKVERILMNLLANALKFSPDEATIEMLVHTHGNQLRIGVRDQGPGIPPEDRERIFNRFYQNDAGEREGGTGIGLSLARELARLQEGDLTVESPPGRGSTFWLTLPLIHADAQSASYRHKNNPIAEPQNGITTAPNPVDQNAKEVLIVEDNPEVRAFVGNLLSEKGYKVVEAINGQDGLEKARTSLPDLILSDVMMPKMDGYAFAKAIRSDERTSHIPLILLTAKASDESKITGLETGVDAYMIKPFNARELEVRIGQLISQRAELRKRFSTATIIRPSEVSTVPMDRAFLKKVTAAIEANMGNERFGVEDLASEAGMSTPTLNRKLKALIDQPAGKLIISMRMQRAADLIRKNAGTIAEIGHQIGYTDPAHFSRAFKKQFGVSPSEFAEK